MIDLVERLRRSLADSAAVPQEQWQQTTLAKLQQGTALIKDWIKSGAGGAKPTTDAVTAAIRAFYERQSFSNLKSARYACFGCADSIGNERYRLIEDEQRFPRLLDCVDTYRTSPRPFRRCYRGLLHGYLGYDPHDDEARPSGKKNWTRLREYLNQRQRQIRVTDSTEPDWVESIARNSDLLTDRACDELARNAMDGDHSRFDTVCLELEISDQSWVVRNFILSQLRAASAKSDHVFKQLLGKMQALLERHPRFLDEGLAALLERYLTCPGAEPDIGLRDFAVTHWGNPWLKLNDKRWGRVSADARQMVTGWLKLKLMRDFFRLLSADGTNDRRRLEFWLQYMDQISDMYFALGGDALYSADPDFKQIRAEMKGRLLYLHASGSPSNNAFLMSIGNYMLVEFGEKGNAFFAFDKRSGLPFKLDGYIAGNTTQLKHDSYELRLRHADTNEGTWEERFRRELEERLNISSDHHGGARPRTPASAPKSKTSPSAESLSEAAFAQFVQTHALRIADKRKVGGALWVYVGKADTFVTKQLKAWGFKYNEHKTAWWHR